MCADQVLTGVTIEELAPYADASDLARMQSNRQVTGAVVRSVFDKVGDNNGMYSRADEAIITAKIRHGYISGIQTAAQFESLTDKLKRLGLNYGLVDQIQTQQSSRATNSPIPAEYLTDEFLNRRYGSDDPDFGFHDPIGPPPVAGPEHVRCLESGGKDCPPAQIMPLDKSQDNSQ